MKFCPRCQTSKPFSDFHKNKALHDGLVQYCKPCWASYRKDKGYKCTLYKTRQAALALLGPICVRCGFDDVRALQIDHVNSDGAEDRRESGNLAIFKRILAGNTEDYQVLCANCNWIKRDEMRELYQMVPRGTDI